MQVVEGLVALHRLGQRLAGVAGLGHVGEAALVARLEGGAVGVHAVEVAADLGGVDGRIKIGEIPFRQRTEGGVGGCGRAGRARTEKSAWACG